MHTRRLFGGALVLATLLLGSCGTAQTATSGTGNTSGMSNGQSTAMAMATAMPGMSNGTMATAAPGSAMTMSNAPYDAQFIDSMMMHHEGAIAMANQALKEGQRQEVKDLAANIVKAQESEIAQMKNWRKQWYPDLAATGGMGMSMGEMTVSTDTSKPFDQRFIEAMIPHHQSAVTMANDTQQKAEHAEIKTLAGNIITDQNKEIGQMQQWLKDWYGK